MKEPLSDEPRSCIRSFCSARAQLSEQSPPKPHGDLIRAENLIRKPFSAVLGLGSLNNALAFLAAYGFGVMAAMVGATIIIGQVMSPKLPCPSASAPS